MNNVCVIIPVYNHSATIGAVIEGVLGYGLKVFVVDDGSTDHLQSVLQEFDGKISVISYSKNRGKGYALQRGFEAARKAGYDYSLTLDADGQHRSEDIALLLNEIEKHPHSLILGSRSLNHENMPSQNSFANHLSNFWFTVQTGKRLSDTQTGFRVYPLQQMKKIRLVTSRYETELELLVRLAWKRIDIVPVKINVYYPPQNERVSHFRPVIDFFRISMLNTALIVLASFYGYPRILIHQLTGFFKSGGIIHRTTLNVVSFLCSVYALIGLTISCLFATVAGFFLFTVGTPTDAKKAWYHNLLFRSMHFFQKYIPRVKVEMRGMENLSSLENRPAVIISNHQSHLDLMCVIALHPKLILVTKEWVSRSPIYGAITQYADFYTINDGAENMLVKLQAMVNKGYSIMIFPEGTRSEDCNIQRFHSGAFHLAQQMNLDIIPVLLKGSGQVLPKSNFLLQKGKIEVEIFPPLTLSGMEPLEAARFARRWYQQWLV